MKKSLSLVLMLITSTAFGQPGIDSLKNLLANKSLEGNSRINALNRLAQLERFSFPDQATSDAENAIALSEKADYLIGRIDGTITIGLIYWVRSSADKAIKYGLWAFKKSDSVKYKNGMMEANLLLGSIYKDLADIDKAEGFTNRGLALAVALDDKEGIARAYNSLGNYNRLRNKDEEALRLYEVGLGYLGPKNNLRPLLLNNIALCYLKKGDDKNRLKAKQYLTESMQIAVHNNNKIAEMQTHFRLGKLFNSSNDFNSAIEQFIIAEKICTDLGTPSNMLEIYAEMINAKIKLGWDKDAYQMVEKYVKLKDSQSSLERARQIAEAETRHETEKKEQTIKILEQEKEIHNMWRDLLVIGVLAALSIAYLIYRLQKSRTRKTRQLLEVQQLLNDKLKGIDKLKSNFFANISHEFRTPLTLILSPLEEVLKKKELSREEIDQLLLMRRNANRLLDLVNQLLDLSKLESGKMEMQVKLVTPEPFLNAIISSFDSWAKFKHVQFIKNFKAVDRSVWLDQDKIEKIIMNLLANAFKFTPTQGTVNFTASIIEKDSRDFLSIIISDTGTGISEDEIDQVFKPFYQSKQSVEGQMGSGIGLSLVKELVSLYQGTITLRSQLNHGSTFSVELPAYKDAFAPNQVSEINSVHNVRPVTEKDYFDNNNNDLDDQSELLPNIKETIIVAEDNSDLRTFIASILKNQYLVYLASDGDEALQLALQHVPNLILSDLMMPKMDGIELTTTIKKDERTSHIPVILLTAKNEQESRLQGLKTGADDYLTKPFSNEELLARIHNLIEQRKLLAEKFRERILVPITPNQEGSMDDKFLQKVRQIVEDNLSEFSFSVELLSNEMNLSRTQLLRKLKALTGLSPNEFIKELRLKKAADMISKRVDTITQIGYAVGFNDQSYFTKCFKKKFGITPTDYSHQSAPAKS